MFKKWCIRLGMIIGLLSVSITMHADEGMWLPYLLGEKTYKEMKQAGMKLSKSEIASINKRCLSKSIVGLVSNGPDATHSFATGSLVSDDGLVLTNFHCVMRYIGRFGLQAKYDFLKYGYWSKDKSEESFCRDLFVKQLLRIEDVTAQMLKGTKGLKGSAFTRKVNANGKLLYKKIKKAEVAKGERGIEIKFQSLFANNQYIMNVYRLYKDIRLVAAPPKMIGMYGGTKDNWSYPRYTADFALLRIYVDAQNRPARHKKTNVPLKTKNFLKIAKKPIEKGDFVMAMGYPGKTRQYIPSFGLKGMMATTEAARKVSSKRVEIIERALEQTPSLHVRYFPMLSSISNRDLKAKGLLEGMRQNDVLRKRIEQENDFLTWCGQDESRQLYADAYHRMKRDYPLLSAYRLAKQYFSSCGLNGAEIISFIGKFEKLVAMHTSKRELKLKKEQMECKRLLGLTKQFFQDWSYTVDLKTMQSAIAIYYKNVPTKFHAPETVSLLKKYKGNAEVLVKEAFEKSIFTHPEKLKNFLQSNTKRDIHTITDDMLYKMAIGFYKVYIKKMNRQLQSLQAKQVEPYRLYMRGLLEMNGDRDLLPPDANNSLRISFGHVSNASPESAVTYRWFTDTKGLLSRANAHQGEEEYMLSPRYRGLLEGQDRPVCFLNDAQTSSGSSGSPILNAHGEIVGLNFDRMWQSVVSDYAYDGNGRSIATDIHYVLWIIDQYAHRNYLKLKY